MAYGATPADWGHFSFVLGLTEDLLPVVSNPKAVISEQSKMAAVGKTPSQYNRGGFAAGFPDWTRHSTSESEIAGWAAQPDYGICLQTRHVRALDIDVDDMGVSNQIRIDFTAALGIALPTRTRSNSGKMLAVFRLEGEFYKRKFQAAGGIVEFLASGQQFIAIGQHTSGVRYEWLQGLPPEIPAITPEQFEKAWATIVAKYATEGARESAAPSKGAKLLELHQNDPVSQRLLERGLVLGATREGRLDITCPFEHEHTGPSSESSTSYYPPNTGGYALGHFKCLHAHCEHRSDQEFEEAIGFSTADDFEDISERPDPTPSLIDIEYKGDPMRFRPLSVHEFTESRDVDWIIKGVIPKSELVVMYGAPGSGKSFLAFDMACGISRGVDWNGLKTKKLRVVVVMAEGSNGVKRRLAAFTKQFGVRLEELDIFFIPAAPNFLEKKDPQDLAAAINALGGVGLVIVDTLARVTAGGNENSGEDMGKALASCGYLYRTTGATIMLIHHSGKNTEAGARGHSSLLGAADAMLEILRSDEDRVMTVAKLKDGEDGREFGFTLLAVSLGFDQDGDDITSCVVEYNTSTKRAISRQLDDKDMEVYDMIADMQKGELAPWLPEITDRVKAVAPHLSRTLLRSVKLLSDKKMIIRGDDDRISLPDSRPSLI